MVEGSNPSNSIQELTKNENATVRKYVGRSY